MKSLGECKGDFWRILGGLKEFSVILEEFRKITEIPRNLGRFEGNRGDYDGFREIQSK